MARIAKEEHKRILQMVQDEGRKVSEVAAQYGCTPANVYAILSKLRQAGNPPDAPASATAPVDIPLLSPAPSATADAPAETGSGDLFGQQGEREPDVPAAPPLPPSTVAAEAASQPQPPVAQPLAEAPTNTGSEGTGTAGRSHPSDRQNSPGLSATGLTAGSRAKPAKPGVGLCMRNADGDESVAPFRSLDDLFSALRPLLRTVAKSPEPVWFCVKPVDLAEMEGSDF